MLRAGLDSRGGPDLGIHTGKSSGAIRATSDLSSLRSVRQSTSAQTISTKQLRERESNAKNKRWLCEGSSMRLIGRILTLFLLAAAYLPAHAQQKAYTNEQLASDAVRLEGQVRKDADARLQKPVDQMRREMLAAAARNAMQAALRVLSQTVAPE